MKDYTWDLVYDMDTGDYYISELFEKLMKQEEGRMLEYLKDELSYGRDPCIQPVFCRENWKECL